MPSNLNYYENELERLADTYHEALTANVGDLKEAIAGASESSIIGVGSGGSYTVASLLCNLHEAYTGRVSRPSTPLEIISNPTLSSASPVFLISAEGKNPDIIEALQRARRHSPRNVHVLANRNDCPLIKVVSGLTNVKKLVFELEHKDGYLATNSLLMDSMLVARAYSDLDGSYQQFPAEINGLHLKDHTIAEWIISAEEFISEASSRGGLIITYSPLLRPIAEDLESKLSEAALLYCQLADFRSFAHGRHLWLSERKSDCTILALIEPSLQNLWAHTRQLLPTDVPILDMPLEGGTPQDLLSGLVAQMHLVARLARQAGIDPARPTVKKFGRNLYYAKLEKYIPRPEASKDRGESSKYDALSARWPFKKRQSSMKRALDRYKASLENQIFRSIVFDYDGTLCSSQRKDKPPSDEILNKLIELADAGIIVGVASGRGGSIQEMLSEVIPERLWPIFHLGLYNGGYITDLSAPPPSEKERATSEFLSHVTRIVGRLKKLGVPIERIRTTHPFQVSIRFYEGIDTGNMWFVIADTLRQAGIEITRTVRSKHSVDILADGVGKSLLIANIIQQYKIDPYHILTIGDQGAWPGNDSDLLEHRFSLSVDVPSRRMDRGWMLAPSHKRDVDGTLWYLRHIQTNSDGTFSIVF